MLLKGMVQCRGVKMLNKSRGVIFSYIYINVHVFYNDNKDNIRKLINIVCIYVLRVPVEIVPESLHI